MQIQKQKHETKETNLMEQKMYSISNGYYQCRPFRKEIHVGLGMILSEKVTQ